MSSGILQGSTGVTREVTPTQLRDLLFQYSDLVEGIEVADDQPFDHGLIRQRPRHAVQLSGAARVLLRHGLACLDLRLAQLINIFRWRADGVTVGVAIGETGNWRADAGGLLDALHRLFPLLRNDAHESVDQLIHRPVPCHRECDRDVQTWRVLDRI